MLITVTNQKVIAHATLRLQSVKVIFDDQRLYVKMRIKKSFRKYMTFEL